MASPHARVVLAVFRPAAALLGRLRYAQKFAMVGLVLLVPLGLVANAYVSLQRGQIAFSAKERTGVAYLSPLVVLVGHVAEARRRAVSTPGAGRTELSAELAARLTEDTARLDGVDSRLGPVLQTTGDWRTARRLLLAAQLTAGPASARYYAFNAASDALLTLVVVAGDASNLTLDPDLDTYYLMDTLQFRLPDLLDTAGRGADQAGLAAAAAGAGAGAGAGAASEGFHDLGNVNGELTSLRAAIARAVQTIAVQSADPQVRVMVTSQFARLDATATALDGRLTAAAADHRVGPDLAAAAERLQAAAAGFAVAAAAALDHLLQVRIDTFAGRAQRVELGTGAAVLLALYLFVGFYLSVAGPIRRIVGTLRAAAAGDLSQRVAVDTRDELSFVASALNDTIAQTEIATDRLSTQATTDTLTALPNRALALDRLQQALLRSGRTGSLMAVLFVDLDRFKMVNDTRGHEAGDEVLRAIAGRLTGMVRTADTVARLAGDEFVVISESLTGAPEAVQLGERIVAALSAPITIQCGGERQVSVGASVGIALTAGNAELLPEDLLRDADVAMYRAKQRGRGRVEVFDDALRVAVERRLDTQDDLRRGIAAGQLRVHYQPIVDTDADTPTGVIGVEAVVRWQHPDRGLLGPGEFMEVAEETGLTVPLGAAVLAQACRQVVAWRAGQPGCQRLQLAVNVSGAQLGHPSFLPAVAVALADSGLDPDALWLEITETSIMTDAAVVCSTLAAIRELGVHLAIDDFGTGYSSLAYLRRFPIEMLKIDPSFVAGLGQDREDEAIVAMIIGLARTLDLVVVAEGVETAGQLDELRRCGCHIVQGGHFGAPASAEELWVPALSSLAAS
jgi:diguanylate cyclase (GGDEF)-like protein